MTSINETIKDEIFNLLKEGLDIHSKELKDFEKKKNEKKVVL